MQDRRKAALTRRSAARGLARALGAVGVRRRATTTTSRHRPATAATSEARTFAAGTTMAEHPGEGRDHDRREVRRAAVRLQEPAHDEVEGFDVDMGKAIADDLGVEPKFVEAISDNRIPFLKDGTVDLILSTMTITAERDEEIDFSDPYYVAHGRILVPKGLGHRGRRRLAGKKVCTALGSTYEETLTEQAPDAELRARRHLLRVPRADPERRGRRGLDRRRDPHRHDHPGRHAQARRATSYHRALRRRHPDGDTEFQDVRRTRTIDDVQDGRALGRRLRGVGRPVHRRGAGAARRSPSRRPSSRRADR